MTAQAPPELAGHRVAIMEWRLLVLWEHDWRDTQRFQEIVDAALTYDDVLGPSDRAQVRVRVADLHQVKGDFPRALTVVNEALRLLHGPETGGFIWSYALNVSMGVQIFLGLWDDLLSSAESLYADRDHVEAHNMAVTHAALVHAWRGDVDAALETRSFLMPVVLSGHDATTGYETRHCPTVIEAFARARREPDRARQCLLPWLEDPDRENHAMCGHFPVLAARLATSGSPAEGSAALVTPATAEAYGDAAPDLACRRHVAGFLAQATGDDTVEE